MSDYLPTYCVIPARGGSTRIKGKNKREFQGMPIVQRAIGLAKSSVFERIIVSSDDPDILNIAVDCGVHTHVRDSRFARDEVGTQDVMANVLQALKITDGVACCLYPCTPMVMPMDLFYAHQMLLMRPCNYVVAVAADPLRDIGNFYFGYTKNFLCGLPLYGTHTGIYTMPAERAIDINTEEDWERAEKMYEDMYLQRTELH